MTTVAVTLERRFDASADELFDAWTDPEILALWFDADGSGRVQVSAVSVDLQIGGQFSFVMGQSKHWGTYRVIDRPHLLSFTWNSPICEDALVTVEFQSMGSETNLLLKHELIPEAYRDDHAKGWEVILGKLQLVLAGNQRHQL